MLLTRIITAAILAPLIILAIFKLPTVYFSLIFAIIMLLAGWEWIKLADITSPFKRVLFYLVMILPMLAVHFWTQILELLALSLDNPNVRDYAWLLECLTVPAVLFWILAMSLIGKAPTSMLNLQLKPRNKLLLGAFILSAAWMFVSRLHSLYEHSMMFYFFVLIWAADISAYFVGRKWGQAKLSPEISPGKTIAGMYGALASAIICAIALGLYFQFNVVFLMDFVLLSLLTVLVSIYGDLFFSVVKRQVGAKDSGAILPGHGGILDRLDSVIAAAPCFYAGLFLIYRTI
jgi:phosphatidate cytidylyltransferase